MNRRSVRFILLIGLAGIRDCTIICVNGRIRLPENLDGGRHADST